MLLAGWDRRATAIVIMAPTPAAATPGATPLVFIIASGSLDFLAFDSFVEILLGLILVDLGGLGQRGRYRCRNFARLDRAQPLEPETPAGSAYRPARSAHGCRSALRAAPTSLRF